MKTKKTIIAVLTAALITAFFIGCNVPLDDLNLDLGKKTSVPDGKTRVRINLGDSKQNARTILPDTSYYTNASKFAKFLLFVYDDTADTGDYEKLPTANPITSDPSKPSTFIYFTYDKFSTDLVLTNTHYYTFTVFACNSDEDFQAWGVSDDGAGNSSIEITGTNDEVNIKLKEIIGSMPTDWNTFVSNGKFSWDLSDLLDDYEIATLSLAEIGGGAINLDDPNASIDLLTSGNEKSSVSDVPVGYYTMVLQLGAPTSYKQTVYVREVIHIWSGLETKYIPGSTPESTAAPLPTLRDTRYAVTFDVSGSDNSNPAPSATVADLGDKTSTVIPSTAPTHSNSADYYFYQWHKTNIGGAVLTGNETIISPITLFAEWVAYKVPALGHYDIDTTNLTQTEGSVDGVPVTVKSGGSYSDGLVTVLYTNTKGGSPISDASTLTAGTYKVTFDVAAWGTGNNRWKKVEGLDPSVVLTVEEKPKLYNIIIDWSSISATPDFDYVGGATSYATLIESTGHLVIGITITNYTDFTSFEWNVDNNGNSLGLINKSTDAYTLELEFNDYSDGSLPWVNGLNLIYVKLGLPGGGYTDGTLTLSATN